MKPREAGGMEWYLRNLIEALGRADNEFEYVLITSDMNHETFDDLPIGWSRVRYDGDDATPASFRRSPDHDRLQPILDELHVDLVFCPFMYVVPHATDLPVVATIPDLQHLALPELFEPFELGSRSIGFQHTAQRADAILTISQTVADEFAREFPEAADRVIAAPLGLNRDCDKSAEELAYFTDAVRAHYRLDFDFALFPANAWPHKNHDSLLLAFDELARRGSDLHLVLTGSKMKFEERLGAKVQQLGIEDRVHHLGYVPREAVFGLYRAAKLLVFPSLFEGFGLPLLEAMRFGTPIACSDLPVLREVGGQVALFFDPLDVEDIASKIQMAASMDSITGSTVSDSLAQFDYDHTARVTLAAFKSVLGSDPVFSPSPIDSLDAEGHMLKGYARWPIHAIAPSAVDFGAGLVPEDGGPSMAKVTLSLDGQILKDVVLHAGQFERIVCDVPSTICSGSADRWIAVQCRSIGSDGPAVGVHVNALSVIDDVYGKLRVL